MEQLPLPADICEMMLMYLDPCSLCAATNTCSQWHNFIQNSTRLWHHLVYQHIDSSIFKSERDAGYSKRDIVLRNYRWNLTKRRWYEGVYSNPSKYSDLPDHHFCIMDVQAWGDILEIELQRQ